MSRFVKRLAVLLLALLLIAALCACTSEKQEAPAAMETPTATETEAPAETETPASAAETPEVVADAGLQEDEYIDK